MARPLFTGTVAFTGTWLGPCSDPILVAISGNQRSSISVAISGKRQRPSAAITHLLEGVDAAGLRLLPRAIVGHATRRRAVGARHGARRRSGATLHCGLAGRCSLARLLCELGDARDHVEDSRVHLWGREGRRRGERRAPW